MDATETLEELSVVGVIAEDSLTQFSFIPTCLLVSEQPQWGGR